MKHQHIPVWAILLPLFILFLSCRDEMADGGGLPLVVEEGIAGTLTFAVGTGNQSLHVVTRATAEEEKYIASLYVFVIDMDPSAALPILSRKWFPDTQGMSHDAAGNLLVSIPAVSCQSVRIFAVANLNTTNQMSNNKEMLEAFHNAKTVAGLESITARLDAFEAATTAGAESGEKLVLVDRLQGSLLSAGHYCSSAGKPHYERIEQFTLASDEPGKLIIRNAGGTLAGGAIRLHHLDARFNFVVKLADGLPAGAYFKLKSWKVKNLHRKSSVHWQNGSTPETPDLKELGSTTEMNANYIDETLSGGQVTSRFTFYAFENRRAPASPFGSVDAVKTAMQGAGLFMDESIAFTAGQAYGLREKKAGADGSFTYAPDNAAYVILKGEYYNPAEQVIGTMTQQCSATVTYLVHLGYIGEENMENASAGSTPEQQELATLNDYRILRNSNYTYTVTVSGVNHIRLEAMTGEEKQPAAEGYVVDSEFDFPADAHYEQRLIRLDLRSVASRMNSSVADYSYTVNTPFTSGPQLVTLHADGSNDRPITLDDGWVRFGYMGNDIYGGLSDLHRRRMQETAGYGIPYTYTYDLNPAESSESDPIRLWGPVALLQNMKSWITIYNTELAKGKTVEGNDADPYIILDGGSYFYIYRYFTVYVDEYYYTQNPVTGTTSNTLWTSFCNTADRTMSIIQKVDQSADGHSHNTRSGTNIRQRPIQTLYSPAQSGQQLVNRAFGIEHTDEYGGNYHVTSAHPLLSASSTPADGLDNTCRALWENKILVLEALGEFTWKGANAVFPLNERTVHGGNGATALRDKRYVNVAALSRNRDNNRNGLIDLDEIVWYVPAKEQMMHLYVGSFIMDDPLYQVQLLKGANMCYATSTFDTSKGLAIQVASKGAALDWLTDGSFSATDRQNCYIRCARNLGNPPVMQPHAPYTGAGYAHEGLATLSPEALRPGVNYIFTYNKLNTTALRSYIGAGALGIHTQFQAAARPYRSFVTAKRLLHGAGDTSVNWDAARGMCHTYSELADRSDKGTWRLPNSCEAMAMLFKLTDDGLWDNTSGRVMWSSTRYSGSTPANEYIGVNHAVEEMVCMPGAETVGYVRCVRDIKVI